MEESPEETGGVDCIGKNGVTRVVGKVRGGREEGKEGGKEEGRKEIRH